MTAMNQPYAHCMGDLRRSTVPLPSRSTMRSECLLACRSAPGRLDFARSGWVPGWGVRQRGGSSPGRAVRAVDHRSGKSRSERHFLASTLPSLGNRRSVR